MELKKLLDTELLVRDIAEGFISEQGHPEDAQLKIYNYTHEAMYSNHWDAATVLCRGLIVRGGREVVARPFRKFFNLNTQQFPETLEKNLPTSAPEITEKYDGALGILYYDNYGRGRIATRGSFISDAAMWASSYWRRTPEYVSSKWPDNYTALFEIICPVTQVVVKYKFEGLVLLALVNNETGEELPYADLRSWANHNDVKCVEAPSIRLEEAVREERPNAEGYVLTWPVEGQSPLKIKVKHEEYRALHKTVTGVSAKGIWELLAMGADLAPLHDKNLPEDFRTFVGRIELDLRQRFDFVREQAGRILITAPVAVEMDKMTREERAEVAAYFHEETIGREYLLPVLFAMVDEKDAARVIWKQLRPTERLAYAGA